MPSKNAAKFKVTITKDGFVHYDFEDQVMDPVLRIIRGMMVGSATGPIAPLFPRPGGKRGVPADEVCRRLGTVNRYYEPFFGGGAVFFNRQAPWGTEIINDKDCHLVNVFRAVKSNPQAVADALVGVRAQVELQAKAAKLRAEEDGTLAKLKSDPDWYDVEPAAWWLAGTCDSRFPTFPRQKHPTMGLRGGKGVYSRDLRNHLEQHISWMSHRLQNVPVLCEDYNNVLALIPDRSHRRDDLTGLLLDPPYDGHAEVYGAGEVALAVRDWAVEHGTRRDLRIALCGYEGLEMPSSWAEFRWTARIGKNRHRERIWFSPACLPGGAS